MVVLYSLVVRKKMKMWNLHIYGLQHRRRQTMDQLQSEKAHLRLWCRWAEPRNRGKAEIEDSLLKQSSAIFHVCGPIYYKNKIVRRISIRRIKTCKKKDQWQRKFIILQDTKKHANRTGPTNNIVGYIEKDKRCRIRTRCCY